MSTRVLESEPVQPDESVLPERWRTVERDCLSEPVLRVAPRLLGKILVSRIDGALSAGRIVEVEAYREDDPASHSYRGVTARTEVMFGPPGHLYVYFTYGMHWCCNVVAEPAGRGAAVLIRALEPLVGEQRMFARRQKARRVHDLCSGPAKAAEALGIDGDCDGVDLVSDALAARVTLHEDGWTPRRRRRGRRIGISKAVEKPWRWWVDGNPHVSRKG